MKLFGKLQLQRLVRKVAADLGADFTSASVAIPEYKNFGLSPEAAGPARLFFSLAVEDATSPHRKHRGRLCTSSFVLFSSGQRSLTTRSLLSRYTFRYSTVWSKKSMESLSDLICTLELASVFSEWGLPVVRIV